MHTSKSVEKTLGMHLHTLDTGSLHPPHVLTNPEEEGEREGGRERERGGKNGGRKGEEERYGRKVQHVEENGGMEEGEKEEGEIIL